MHHVAPHTKEFQVWCTIVAVGILVAGVLASMNFGTMSAEAQTTIHGNQTVNGKTMAGNTTANMTKGNSTSMPTPEGPSPHKNNLTSIKNKLEFIQSFSSLVY